MFRPDVPVEVMGGSVLRLPPTRHYKAIVVSDLHFPRRDSHPKYLYEFLQHNTCDTLILAGDAHEGYEADLEYFRELHLRVWDLIAERRSQGMRVIDIPGNHDSYKRRETILGHKAFDTEYWNDLVVDSAQGKTYVFHGDNLDGQFTKRYDKVAFKVAKKIAIGNRSLLDIHSGLEKMGDMLFGGVGKKRNSLAVEFAAASLAESKGCQAVLSGHTHKPSSFLPVEGKPDVLYGNSGAWVGGLATAMALRHDGTWELIDWAEKRKTFYDTKPNGLSNQHRQAAFRDVTMAEFDWQKAQHALFAQESLVLKTKETIEKLDRIKKRVQSFMSEAEEKLEKVREYAESVNKQAQLEKIEPDLPQIAPAPVRKAELSCQ